MSTVRMGHSAAGIGGRVLVMGGYDGFMVMKSCESYGALRFSTLSPEHLSQNHPEPQLMLTV